MLFHIELTCLRVELLIHMFQSMKVVYVPVTLFVGTASVVPTHSGERDHGSLGTLYGEVVARQSLWCHQLPSEAVGNEP